VYLYKNGELKSNTNSKNVRLTLENKAKLTLEVHQQLIKRTIWFTSTGKESNLYFPILQEHFTIQSYFNSMGYGVKNTSRRYYGWRQSRYLFGEQDGRVVKAPNFHCQERTKYTPDKRGFKILFLKEVHRLGGWC
jgi:hypothetical protein